jgi:hypothetical protein
MKLCSSQILLKLRGSPDAFYRASGVDRWAGVDDEKQYPEHAVVLKVTQRGGQKDRRGQ